MHTVLHNKRVHAATRLISFKQLNLVKWFKLSQLLAVSRYKDGF